MSTVKMSYKQVALAAYLRQDEEPTLDLDDLQEDTCQDSVFEFGRHSYRVLTDSEADTAFAEAVDSYIDEIIMGEVPENLRFYFDRDRFHRDSQIGGRGVELSRYDGEEREVHADTVFQYIKSQWATWVENDLADGESPDDLTAVDFDGTVVPGWLYIYRN